MTIRHTIRVLLVDDHAIVRVGLRFFLVGAEDITVVGEAGSGAEALTRVAELEPDVVLMDLVMPGMDGVAAIQQLRLHFPHVRVLALTGAKRWKGLPDVPTMQEAGFKGYNLINWFGLWLPAGASPEVMARIHAEVVKALADPHVKEQFDAQGLEGVGMPPAEFARFVESESKFINELARKIKALGHDVVLLHAKFIRPFMQTNKTDAADARAIWTAVQQPGMRTVAAKSEEQQTMLSLHRIRSLLVKFRTMQVNQLRGLLYEFGASFRTGRVAGLAEIRARMTELEEALPGAMMS